MPRRRVDLQIPHPPAIMPQINHRQRMRFSCTAAQVTSNITFKNLLDTINIATTAVNAFQLFDQVRVNFVELWAAPVQGAAPAQVAIEFAGAAAGVAGDGRVYSDSSMGVEPAHLRVVPSKGSQVSQWQFESASTAFLLTCPVAAVVDVDLSFRATTVAPVATTNAPVGATAGDIYYRGLDGVAVAGTQLPPVTPGNIN